MGDALSKEPVSQELFISLEFLKKPDFFKCIFFFFFCCTGSLMLCGLLSICRAQASHCGALSRWGAQASVVMGSVAAAPELQSTDSIGAVHGLSCSAAYGIFLDQGLNPCLLQWQVDSLPLSHQGNPRALHFRRSSDH